MRGSTSCRRSEIVVRALRELPSEVPVLYLVSQVIFPYGASQVRLRMQSNLQLLDDLPQPVPSRAGNYDDDLVNGAMNEQIS